jgi:hypothetical protein
MSSEMKMKISCVLIFFSFPILASSTVQGSNVTHRVL